MTQRLIHLAFALALLPGKGHAFWGPKNFDDCVLQNTKGVTSDTAANMIYESCRAKFPTAEEIKEKIDAIKARERYRACGYSTDIKKSNGIFYVDSFEQKSISEKFNQTLGEIIIENYDVHNSKTTIHNKSNFALSTVVLGLTNSKNCPTKYTEYQAITQCSGLAGSLGPQRYGSFRCSQIPPSAKRYGFCLIGYAPVFNAYDDSLLSHMESRGYCRNTSR